jgi:hypothetical protein
MSLPNLMVLLPQSRDSSHHVAEDKCPPQLTPLLQSIDSTDHLVSWKWLGGNLPLILLWKDQQEYWHLHHSHCRNTLIYVHMTVHCPNLWHEPRLANCRCAWSQRLCVFWISHLSGYKRTIIHFQQENTTVHTAVFYCLNSISGDRIINKRLVSLRLPIKNPRTIVICGAY